MQAVRVVSAAHTLDQACDRTEPSCRPVGGCFVRCTMRGLLLALVAGLMLGVTAQAATVPKVHCKTVRKCRADARWNHKVMVRNATRLAIADGRVAHFKRIPVCHHTAHCRVVVLGQARSRVWAENAWHHVMFDASPVGFQRIIRYRFTVECGASTVPTALRVARAENEFVINRYPSPTSDYGGWQVNYPAHHGAFGNGSDKAFFAAVLPPWSSTGIAIRWSSCGSNWSPTWSAATNLGIA